jgi:hypothetical protein
MNRTYAEAGKIANRDRMARCTPRSKPTPFKAPDRIAGAALTVVGTEDSTKARRPMSFLDPVMAGDGRSWSSGLVVLTAVQPDAWTNGRFGSLFCRITILGGGIHSPLS